MTTTALLSPTYLLLDVRRILRNRRAMIFTIAMPTLIYLVFGVSQGDRNDSVGHGNVAFYVLAGMAAYGAILSAASNSAAVSLEQQNGWTRTLSMTPLRPRGYVATKVAVALTMAALPVVVLAVVGMVSGAHASPTVWVACLLLSWAGASVFAALGLAVGSLLKSEGAMQALGGIITLLAFAGNVFVPLRGTMLTVAEFTPMFGVANLARYPLTDRATVFGDHVSLIACAANILVWGTLFAVAAGFFYSRSTNRQ